MLRFERVTTPPMGLHRTQIQVWSLRLPNDTEAESVPDGLNLAWEGLAKYIEQDAKKANTPVLAMDPISHSIHTNGDKEPVITLTALVYYGDKTK